MRIRKIVFFPVLLSMIVSMNWVVEMSIFLKRCLAILTLGMILWIIYDHLKEPDLAGRIIIVLCFVVVTSVLLILGTLLKIGW
jgi:hypothetical protein